MADPQVTTATQELLFGIGSQVLVLDAPEPLQSVNSVTVRELVNDDTAPAEDATQGSAAVAANPRSITAAAGYGQANRRTITVANSSNVVTGQRWVIAADAETRWETFEVVNVETTTITARHPILNDYASGDTISCLRWTIAVRDAWAADLTNLSPNLNPNPRYRVAWDVTLADAPSTRRIYETNFDLVRHAAVCPVNPIDVVEAFGGWLDLLGPDDRATQGREVIAEATRLVKLDLYRRSIADQALRNAEVQAALIINRTIYLTLADNARRGSATPEQAETARLDYEALLNGLVDSAVLAVDAVGGGGATTVVATGERLLRR